MFKVDVIGTWIWNEFGLHLVVLRSLQSPQVVPGNVGF
jgi:hypothetical protein